MSSIELQGAVSGYPQTYPAAVLACVIDASQNFEEIRRQIIQRVVTQLQTAKITKKLNRHVI
ncbi:hypothetical protein [Nostoc commune]|uniref:hypothetical protein n=1 Tax=Nostoc commune TaxID=1178 RepID=UPI0018C507B7|nr:hypothetical protein [Nostoc commune]MBG1260968.1 hypothetical protein [Nostoc commune BAE]